MDRERAREIKKYLDDILVEFLKYGGSLAVAYTLIEIFIRVLGE